MQKSQPLEVIYDFEFDDGRLYEVRFNDVNKFLYGPEQRCQWYLILYGRRYDLHFTRMNGTKRYFAGIQLDRCGESPNLTDKIRQEIFDESCVCIDVDNLTLTLIEDNLVDQWELTDRSE